ncbi:MAG TPA: mandelate racemase/muconate lactonizing enzyme family protein [Candidatus Acidoferrum sp.]
MKITRLKTAVVEGNFNWTFVRLETDEGISGLGECFFAPGLTAILRSLEPLLIGEDPRDIHRLFRKLRLATSGAGSVAGIIYNAISGIEAALWDVLGQLLGVPIYRLLGGKFRGKVRIYADCHGGEALECLDEVLRSRPARWVPTSPATHVAKDYFGEAGEETATSPHEYRRRALEMKAAGFTALKFDLDVPGTQGADLYNRVLSNRAIDHAVSMIAAVREAVGVDTDIAVDCHWRYNASDIVTVARELEPFRLLWLEDPVPPDNIAALREVSAKVRVPIATGENLFLFEGFQEIIAQHALSVVTPDLQKVGGLSIAQSIAQFADVHSMPVAPHNISSPVGTLVAAHFCASIPNFLALEFHAADVPFWNELVDGLPKPIIQNGFIHLTEKPGLGVTLNEEVARRYARKDEPFFE